MEELASGSMEGIFHITPQPIVTASVNAHSAPQNLPHGPLQLHRRVHAAHLRIYPTAYWNCTVECTQRTRGSTPRPIIILPASAHDAHKELTLCPYRILQLQRRVRVVYMKSYAMGLDIVIALANIESANEELLHWWGWWWVSLRSPIYFYFQMLLFYFYWRNYDLEIYRNKNSARFVYAISEKTGIKKFMIYKAVSTMLLFLLSASELVPNRHDFLYVSFSGLHYGRRSCDRRMGGPVMVLFVHKRKTRSTTGVNTRIKI